MNYTVPWMRGDPVAVTVNRWSYPDTSSAWRILPGAANAVRGSPTRVSGRGDAHPCAATDEKDSCAPWTVASGHCGGTWPASRWVVRAIASAVEVIRNAKLLLDAVPNPARPPAPQSPA